MDSARPKDFEILQQLERIIQSKRFEPHPRLGELLKALVEADVRNTILSEQKLGIMLFGKRKGYSTAAEGAVRERKRLMKKEIEAYYKHEGRDDRVIFEFPNRGKFRPYYNSRFDAAEAVTKAERLLGEILPNITPMHSTRIVSILEECIEKEPNYAPAHAALAEVLIIFTACDMPKYFPVRESILRAEEAAYLAVQLDVLFWKARIVVGAVHCLRFHWTEAETAFHTALCIDGQSTREHLFFIVFLLAMGRFKDAGRCMSDILSRRSELRFAEPLRIFMCYLQSDFRIVYSLLLDFNVYGSALRDDERHETGEVLMSFQFWPAYFFAAGVFLQSGIRDDLFDTDFQFKLAARYAEIGCAESRINAFPGFKLLTFGILGKKDKKMRRLVLDHLYEWAGGPRMMEWFGGLPEPFHKYPTPITAFSYALTYLGLGKTKTAVEKLSEACDEGYPWTVLLHVWPFLTGLKDRKDFQKLLRRMNFPSNGNGLCRTLGYHPISTFSPDDE